MKNEEKKENRSAFSFFVLKVQSALVSLVTRVNAEHTLSHIETNGTMLDF